jgi:hypothetical protein
MMNHELSAVAAPCVAAAAAAAALAMYDDRVAD